MTRNARLWRHETCHEDLLGRLSFRENFQDSNSIRIGQGAKRRRKVVRTARPPVHQKVIRQDRMFVGGPHPGMQPIFRFKR